jgi:hypothetical protein
MRPLKKAVGTEADFETPEQFKEYGQWFAEIANNSSKFKFKWPKWKVEQYRELFYDGETPGDVITIISNLNNGY